MIAENAVDSRPKNFLTESEIETFLKAARKGRHGARNVTTMWRTSASASSASVMGEQSGLLTRMATESVSSCVQMRS